MTTLTLMEILLAQDDWAEGLATPITSEPSAIAECHRRGWLEARPNGYRVTRAGRVYLTRELKQWVTLSKLCVPLA